MAATAWKVSHDRLREVPYRYPDEPGVHYDEWVVRHRVFHRALVNACGSQWLLGFRDVLHEQSERYRRLSIGATSAMIRDVEAEHAAIVAGRAAARRRCGRGCAGKALLDHDAFRRTKRSENPGGKRLQIGRQIVAS